MKKKLIRLTESDLHRIVKESVNRVLKEDFNHDQYVQLVQGAYDKVAEATNLISEASSMVQSEGTYHIGYLNKAYKALGTAIGALQAADASRPKSGRRGYLDMGEDV